MHTLKQLRLDQHITQEVLARRSGVQAPHISMIEHGRRNPNERTRVRLAEVLKCQPDELISKNGGNGQHD